MLNHVPTIGFCVGLVIFLIGLARRHDSLKRTGLTVFFVVANVSIATYVTGVGAEELIKDRPDVSAAAIRAHEDAALLAFTLMEITGFFAWLALWQWRRIPRQPPRWTLPVVLVLSVVTFALMANAANLGGEISHAEIRAASAATAAPARTARRPESPGRSGCSSRASRGCGRRARRFTSSGSACCSAWS